MIPIISLPTELQLSILSYLPFVDQIIASAVCRTWRSLIFSPSLRQSRYFAASPQKCIPRGIHQFFRPAGWNGASGFIYNTKLGKIEEVFVFRRISNDISTGYTYLNPSYSLLEEKVFDPLCMEEEELRKYIRNLGMTVEHSYIDEEKESVDVLIKLGANQQKEFEGIDFKRVTIGDFMDEIAKKIGFEKREEVQWMVTFYFTNMAA